MNPATPNEMALAIGVLAVLATAGSFIYGMAAVRIARDGGAVQVHAFGLPELAFGTLMGGYFALLSAKGLMDPAPRAATEEGMVSGATAFAMVVAVLWALLKVRGNRLRELFGFANSSPGTVVGTAIGLLLAAFPIVAALNLGIQQLLPAGERSQQEIVQYFLQAHQRGDTRALVMTFVLGVVVAPICEEFIFRGFLYGVAKRYLGIGAAMVLVALLFAAVHLNLSALPGLAALSICFTIANERSGSLFTSMLMHALFNTTSLVAMMFWPQFSP